MCLAAKRERENKREAPWPLSRAEISCDSRSYVCPGLLPSASVGSVQTPSLSWISLFISEETCRRTDTLLSVGKGRDVIRVTLFPRASWSAPCVIPFPGPPVALTYCNSVRMYSKAVVCRLLSPHFTKKLCEARRGPHRGQGEGSRKESV